MRDSAINLSGLVILVADPSVYFCSLTHSILRGFGATNVLEVRSSEGALMTLMKQKVDILLCDSALPPCGGLSLTHTIRRESRNEHRTLPILIMCGDTRDCVIRNARDAGANMVVAKPMSPTTLYDRLAWIAFNPRKFVDAPTYFGPDRRFKIEGSPNGVERRTDDHLVKIENVTVPAMADYKDGVAAAETFAKP